MQRIYFDHAATTPLDPEVLDAMLPYLREDFGNPSSVHSFGQRARGAIDEARAKFASLIGARDAEVVFTGSGTEADNMAIVGATQSGGPDRTDLVTSAIEHHAVLNGLKALDRGAHKISILGVNEDGRIDLAPLDRVIDKTTALVSIMFANNETGILQPIPDVVRVAKAKGALVHTDAVQGLGKVPIDVRLLEVDLLTASAHKIHGPKGVGALYVRSGTRMTALVRGGSQERNRRAGTENVAGIVGFGKAAELAQSRLAQDSARVAALRNRLEEALIAAGNGTVSRNGSQDGRVCSTTNLSFDGIAGEDLLVALDMAGIAASTGAACAAGSSEPSHVLKAMGLSTPRVNSSLRFSLGRGTTEREVNLAVEAVRAAMERLRKPR